jgi:uncharacterized LabA/DUF88 family protein
MEPRKIMAFIDGENLVFRYQSMKDKGWNAQPGVFHETDTYVWSNSVPLPSDHSLIRANYYTSVIGDDAKIDSVCTAMKKMEIRGVHTRLLGLDRSLQYGQHLYPLAFKKPSKSNKTKIVDIRMTVDILTNVYEGNVDSVCILSGDGDYEEVIREVMRRGKRVYIGAFSDGLSPKLKNLCDDFIDLDPFFFKPQSGAG